MKRIAIKSHPTVSNISFIEVNKPVTETDLDRTLNVLCQKQIEHIMLMFSNVNRAEQQKVEQFYNRYFNVVF